MVVSHQVVNGGRGGGGAGGLRTNAAPSFPHNLPSSTMAYPGSGTVSYTVTVGAGGLFGQNNNGTDGGNSSIVHPSLIPGTGIVATGGGYGAYNPGLMVVEVVPVVVEHIHHQTVE